MRPDVIGIDASRASVDRKTGTEWYSAEIINALAQIDERPRLRLYHRDGNARDVERELEHVHIDQSRIWTHLGLNRELRRAPVDALFVPAHVIPRNHPAATVVTIHDLGFRHEPEAHTLQRRLMLDMTTRWNARQARRVIVPSDTTSRDLQSVYGTNPDIIDVIPHGLDHDRFRQLDEITVRETLDELGIKRPYFLFVSTLQPRKNLGRLVAAFESPGFERFQLVVAGAAGWKAEPIIQRMRLSTRQADIRRLGYVADRHIPALYNGASAFVLPSLYEGFGMGALEAMACGCPVVVSSASSLPEVTGDAGIIVDPRSVRSIRGGLMRTLDPKAAPELRACGLKRAHSFTWERAARETLSTIYRAFEGTRARQ